MRIPVALLFAPVAWALPDLVFFSDESHGMYRAKVFGEGLEIADFKLAPDAITDPPAWSSLCRESGARVLYHGITLDYGIAINRWDLNTFEPTTLTLNFESPAGERIRCLETLNGVCYGERNNILLHCYDGETTSVLARFDGEGQYLGGPSLRIDKNDSLFGVDCLRMVDPPANDRVMLWNAPTWRERNLSIGVASVANGTLLWRDSVDATIGGLTSDHAYNAIPFGCSRLNSEQASRSSWTRKLRKRETMEVGNDEKAVFAVLGFDETFGLSPIVSYVALAATENDESKVVPIRTILNQGQPAWASFVTSGNLTSGVFGFASAIDQYSRVGAPLRFLLFDSGSGDMIANMSMPISLATDGELSHFVFVEP